MSVDQRDILRLYRERFFLFASKVFSILNSKPPNVTAGFMAIAHAMERVASGETKRLLVMVPPRSGKSIFGSVALPAFLLGRDPTKRIICASYSGDLATKFHRDCRTVMTSNFYRRLFTGTAIGSKNTESELETHRGGGRYATSVGGTLTGRGGNLIVIDDPIKPADAMSRLARQEAWDWFTGTVGSRLDDKSQDSMMVVMQRLHVDDLAGRLIDHGGWEQLIIPAISDTHQELRISAQHVKIRNPGDVLDPYREPLEVLEQVRRDLGSATFEAQYQQQPVPEEGGLVRWLWFKSYTGAPPRHPGEFIAISWDTAMKSSELNDYSVGIVALVKPNSDIYILDVIRERLDFPSLTNRVLQEAQKRRAMITLIEEAGSGTALLQQLQGRITAAPVRPTEEKQVRFQRVTPMIEGGRVYLPASAPWIQPFKRELLTFPDSSNDDQIDALSQLLNWVHQRSQNQVLQGRYSRSGR
jgi:predicted phage terminase large subunit-like protein